MKKNENQLGRKPRVLWANSYCMLDTSSGASMSVREILRQFVNRGYEVEIIGATNFDDPKGVSRFKDQWEVLKKSDRDSFAVNDGNLLHKLVKTKSTERKNMTRDEENALVVAYTRLLDKFKPDLVFTYGGQLIDAFFSLEARLRGIPSAAYLVNGNYHGTRWCRDVDVVLTDTQATSNFYREKSGYTPKVIGKFIDPEMVIAKEHIRKNLTFINPSWAKGVGVIAVLAQILETKRPDIQIDVVESRGDWKTAVKVVSKNIFRQEKQSLKNVNIISNTPDMKQIYARSRVVISPSLWWESGSRVLAEAMMNGIPALVSKSGGNLEMVQDGGILIDLPDDCFLPPYTVVPQPNALNELVALIEKLWDDQSFYINQINKAVSVGFTYHLMDSSFEKLEKAIFPLIQKKAGDNNYSALLKQNHKHNIKDILPVPPEKNNKILQSHGETGSIQFLDDNTVIKTPINLAEQFNLDLAKREIHVLKLLKNKDITPKIISIDEEKYEIKMENAGNILERDTYSKIRKILKKKLKKLKTLNIEHNDLFRENILVKSTGDVSIIDYNWASTKGDYSFGGCVPNIPKFRKLYDDDCLSHFDFLFDKEEFDELHIFVLWDKSLEEVATKEIKKRNTIILRISHTNDFYSLFDKGRVEFLNNFYANKNISHGSKGADGFILYIVGQKKSLYENRIDPLTKKRIKVNVANFETKHLIRKGKLGVIHASNNSEEAFQNAEVLGRFTRKFPVPLFNKQRPSFENFVELFEELDKKNVDYVVLRNWEPLPAKYQVDEHGDIDILVNDYSYAKKVMGGRAYKHKLHKEDPRFGFDVEMEGWKVANHVLVGGREIEFDIRYLGDGYYPVKWQEEMLRNPSKHIDIKVLNAENHFYSLLYHALLHKKTISKTYVEKFKTVASELLNLNLTNEQAIDVKFLWSLLEIFLNERKYKPTVPLEKNIPFDFNDLLKV